jgi:hypothetical protein
MIAHMQHQLKENNGGKNLGIHKFESKEIQYFKVIKYVQ